MLNTKKSDSTEQQELEIYVSEEVEKWLECDLQKNPKIFLAEGVHIEPDLYSEEEHIICEIFAHQGALKVGQQHKVSQDILKMLLLDKIKGIEYRKVIVVADEKVESYLRGKSFVAESIRQFGIEIMKIDISADIRKTILAAQARQVMVNI